MRKILSGITLMTIMFLASCGIEPMITLEKTTFAPGEERTLMRALFKAGGVTKFAKDKAVKLIRYLKDGERDVQMIDAQAIIEEGHLDQDIDLQAGDMLIVPQKMINF